LFYIKFDMDIDVRASVCFFVSTDLRVNISQAVGRLAGFIKYQVERQFFVDTFRAEE
jgi:hypothetical protein